MRAPHDAPRAAPRRALSVRPTALGVKAAFFGLLLLLAFFAAAYANLLFLLLVFLGVLAAGNAFAALRNLRGVRARIDAIEPFPAGAGCEVRARIEPAGRAGVVVELRSVAAIRLPDGRGRLPPLSRGLYPIHRATVSSTWPLGLLRVGAPVEAPRELVVYPAPLGAEESRGAGDLAGPPHAGSMQPSGLREFRPGDERRHVHWKATARRGELILKEWEGGAGEGAELLLDRRMAPDAFERALSRVAGAALAARERKEPLTFHTQGLSATFGGGHRPWNELLRHLAAAEPLPAEGPPPPPVSPAVRRIA